MKQGTIDLVFLGAIFLVLQFWWMKMVIRKRQPEKAIDMDKDPLLEQKKRLERLLNE